jgi:hypothetical protein
VTQTSARLFVRFLRIQFRQNELPKDCRKHPVFSTSAPSSAHLLKSFVFPAIPTFSTIVPARSQNGSLPCNHRPPRNIHRCDPDLPDWPSVPRLFPTPGPRLIVWSQLQLWSTFIVLRLPPRSSQGHHCDFAISECGGFLLQGVQC